MVRARLAPASLLLASSVVAFDPKPTSAPERYLGLVHKSAEQMRTELKNSDAIIVLRINKATNFHKNGEGWSWKSLFAGEKRESDVYAEVSMNSAQVYRVAVKGQFDLQDEYFTEALREQTPKWDTTFMIPLGSDPFLEFDVKVKNYETFRSDPVLLKANLNIPTTSIYSNKFRHEEWCGESRHCNEKQYIDVSLAKVSLKQAACIMGGLVDPEECI